MGLLSSSVSITRYRVDGQPADPIIEAVESGLKQNTIYEIDNEETDKAVGWTAFDTPYRPMFEGSSFIIGPHFVFSLRIDKKSISAKIVNKHHAIEMAKKLAESRREYLSKEEKKLIKDAVVHALHRRIPATPNLYDVLWKYEARELWFFSNQKAANEALESLFSKSFKLNLIRLFPYTAATLTAGLSDSQVDSLSTLSPVGFTE
ncbi:MAG: recombination-associated protein RdgC [Desulfobacterales bacterium]|jgi:DNA recombination-dependent growth factor C|nr:recombination-associated protein RdgC [Desulfobacterales bacterium]